MKNMEDNLLVAIRKVVKDWGLLEVVLCFIFFPLSLFYILLRVFQEIE